jgi:glycosyltransferase involved in cell wall biosynthesis
MFAKIYPAVMRLPWLPDNWLNKIYDDLRVRPDILQEAYKAYLTAIAPSVFLEKAYLKNGFKQLIHLQHFGVDIDRSLKTIRIKDKVVRFAYIGQLAYHKGVDLLIDAFRYVSNAELSIYGSEDQDKRYTCLLKEKASLCRGNVRFKGTFLPDQMAEILSKIDFLIIPSRWYENSPLVLLYALASHTPVIVSNVEGMTEFVKNGINGFVFNRGDSDDLKKVLDKIAKNPKRSKQLYMTTNYLRSTKDMCLDVLEIYKKILSVNRVL